MNWKLGIACLLILSGCMPVRTENTEVKTEPQRAIPFTPFVGKTLEEAVAEADRLGRKWRIVERDGRALPATRDYWPGRVNFAVMNDVVVRVTSG